MTKTGKWGLAAVGLLLACTYAWLRDKDGEVPAPSAAATAGKHGATEGSLPRPPSSREAGAVSKAAPGNSPGNNPGISNPYLLEAQTGASRKAAFDKLAALSDPVAAHTAAILGMSCQLYGDDTYSKTVQRIELSQQPERIKSLQKAVAAREREKCVGFDSSAFKKATELERYVRERGDPRGVAMGLPIPPVALVQQVALAQQGARSADPLAIDQVGMFFTARADVAQNSQFELGNGVSVPSTMIRDAFFLAACDFGQDCGPQNLMVAARCVNAGWCDASSLEDSLMRYTYTPADADNLNAARQVVLRGIQTGQWPQGFWDTPHP